MVATTETGMSWRSTEGDIGAIIQTSKFMVAGGLIPQPLEWAPVLENIKKAAPLLKKAYEAAGSKPDAAEFAKSDAGDLRGAPTWEQEGWKRG